MRCVICNKNMNLDINSTDTQLGICTKCEIRDCSTCVSRNDVNDTGCDTCGPEYANYKPNIEWISRNIDIFL